VMELRAIWYSLPAWDGAPSASAVAPSRRAGGLGGLGSPTPASVAKSSALEKGKAEWRAGIKSRIDDMVYKLAAGKLPSHLVRNPVYEVPHSLDMPILACYSFVLNTAVCVVTCFVCLLCAAELCVEARVRPLAARAHALRPQRVAQAAVCGVAARRQLLPQRRAHAAAAPPHLPGAGASQDSGISHQLRSQRWRRWGG
jgi:hypothetical protein